MRLWRDVVFGVALGVLLLRALAALAFSPLWPPPILSTGGYVGPGDIIALDAFYSCTFSYSRAYAQPGTNHACLLYKHLNSATEPGNNISQCVLYVKPDGNVDLDTTAACPATDGGPNQTVDTWGQYRAKVSGAPAAVGTASASSGDLNVTALTSGTVVQDMRVNATSAWIVSQTSGTPGGVGHYQLSSAISFGSQAFNGSRAHIKVETFYNQVGNSGYDAVSGPDGVVGTVLLRFGWGNDGQCLNASLPCVHDFNQDTNPGPYATYLSSANIPVAAPLGVTAVGARRSGNTSTRIAFLACSAMQSQTQVENAINVSTTNGWKLGLSTPLITESVDVVHSSAGYRERMDVTPGNVVINVDGSESSDSSVAGTATSPVSLLNNQPTNPTGFAGFQWGESGCKMGGAAFDATVRANIVANEKFRYGTP